MSQRQEELVRRLKQHDMSRKQFPWLANMPRASVLVPLLLRNGEPHVLLTVRSEQLRTGKGEVCFPGGKRDPADANDIVTALREAQEEIGLPPGQVEVACQFLPIINMAGIVITPVISFVPSDFEPKPNPDEVSATFLVPLAFFLNASNHRDTLCTVPGDGKRLFHAFTYQEANSGEAERPSYTVWGLTALICIVVATLVLGQAPEYQIEFETSNPQGVLEEWLNDRRVYHKL